MRRYSDETLLYEPGDKVLINWNDERIWVRIVSPPSSGNKENLYRVSIPHVGIRRISDHQIIKQADTGGVGFIKYLD